MQLPAFLPQNLMSYSRAENEDNLFILLKEQLSDFVLFLGAALDDETWTEDHLSFVKNALDFFSERYREGNLTQLSAQHLATAIQKHYRIIKTYIPEDIIFQLQERSIPGNSILSGSGCNLFQELIQAGHHQIHISDIDDDLFMLLLEFLNTNLIPGLWKHEESQIYALLRIAERLQIKGLSQLCQEVLKRYISSYHALEKLIEAHKNSWPILKQYCCHLIDKQSFGIKLEHVEPEYQNELPGIKIFVFEFLSFSDHALSVFQQLKELITHLICSGSLIEEPQFSMVLKQCPRLYSLDISNSLRFTESLNELPNNLSALNLSKCPWLTQTYLRKIIALCPNLQQLNLSNNAQLVPTSWGDLQRLSKLHSLDISRCEQIHDDTFLLILKACRFVAEWNLEECIHLSERSFIELVKERPFVTSLNLSRCQVTDGVLMEIANRCTHLRSLYLARCRDISEKGVQQIKRRLHTLKELDLTQTRT